MPRKPVTLFEYLQGERGDLERKPSRASIRDKYGITSRIDASAPQSELDTTPSGRAARLKQAHPEMSRDEIAGRVADEFNAYIKGGSRLRYSDTPTAMAGAASNFSDRTPNAAMGFSAASPQMGNPVPIDPGYQPPVAPVTIPNVYGAGSSAFPVTPAQSGFNPVPNNFKITPLAFNLSTPSILNAATMAQFAAPPVKAYPPPWKAMQKPVGSYMASMLNGASKYLT